MTALSSDTLFIRIGQKEFIFASYNCLNKQKLEYVCYKLKPDVSPNANMHDALKRIPFVNNDFHNVKVLVDGETTLVPLNEFDEEDCDSLYYFNLPNHQKRCRVFYDTLPHIGAILLFGMDKDLCHTLEEAFNNIYFQSTETSLILHFASCSPFVLGNGRLFVDIEKNKVSIAAFRSGKIERYNTFVLHHMQDALFYSLSMAKQWNMDAAVDEIYVSGAETEAQELVVQIKEYFPRCFLNHPSDEFGKIGGILHTVFPYDMIIALLKAY